MTNVIEQFLLRREEAGDAVSIVGSRSYTYNSLDDLSRRFATALLQLECRPGDRVGLLAPKDPASVAALLAIYRIGCIYVPIDIESPTIRLVRILNVAECRVLIGHPSTLESIAAALEQLPGAMRPAAVISSDKLQSSQGVQEQSTAWLNLPDNADDDVPIRSNSAGIAQLLFTSGSTGTPKGVKVKHTNIVSFVAWANNYFHVSRGDRISCHSPLSFDLATWDILGGLSAGAEVHLVEPRLNISPKALISFIADRRLTQWFSVPTLLAFIASFDVLRAGDFPALKHLIWCGEVIAPQVLTYWKDRLPHVEFTNLYGPTETTIASSYYTIPADYSGGPVPIGYACGGEQVDVVDRDLTRLEHGQVGELLISGDGVTDGYWREPERTSRAFVALRKGDGQSVVAYRTGDLGYKDRDGCLHFKGRVDSQIKCRGHRIELGEIESALSRLEEVLDGVVLTYRGTAFSDVEIGCAVVTRSGSTCSASDLRLCLAERLPKYMIPTRWLLLERMPTNANGKADRTMLSEQINALNASD